MQGLFVGCIYIGSGDPCEGLTSVTQQIRWIQLKHFIAETYVQLATTKAMCYSTS